MPVGTTNPPDPPPTNRLRPDWLSDLDSHINVQWCAHPGSPQFGRFILGNGALCQLTQVSGGIGHIFASYSGIPLRNAEPNGDTSGPLDILMSSGAAYQLLECTLDPDDPWFVVHEGTRYACVLAQHGAHVVMRLVTV